MNRSGSLRLLYNADIADAISAYYAEIDDLRQLTTVAVAQPFYKIRLKKVVSVIFYGGLEEVENNFGCNAAYSALE